jgi:hypothetical protein
LKRLVCDQGIVQFQRRLIALEIQLLALSEVGVPVMSDDEQYLCSQITAIVQKEFINQYHKWPSRKKFPLNTSYRCDVCFVLLPSGEIDSVGLEKCTENVTFDVISLKAIVHTKMPNGIDGQHLKMRVQFYLDSEVVEEIKAEAKIERTYVINKNEVTMEELMAESIRRMMESRAKEGKEPTSDV